MIFFHFIFFSGTNITIIRYYYPIRLSFDSISDS